MNKLNPWTVGGALAITAAIFYVVCAASYNLVRRWPGFQ